MADDVKLRLHCVDDFGTPYTEDWYCDIPPLGVQYTVVRQEWVEDYTVRKILEVELASH